MRRASLVALSLAAAGATFAAAKPANESLDRLVLAAIAAPSNVSYEGTVEVVRMGSRDAEATVYRVEHRAPNLTRRDYTAPSALLGDSVVSDGARDFTIDRRHRRIFERGNSALDVALDADYALMLRNYHVLQAGSESFDGRDVVDLVLVNAYSDRTTMRMRVDAVKKVVLDRQEFGIDGSLVSEARFEEIRYAGEIPPSEFALPARYALVRKTQPGREFDRPDRVVRLAGFAAREPRALPDGFAPVGGDIVEFRGVRTMHLLYSDGLRTVSLFENAQASRLEVASLQEKPMRIAGHDAEYAEMGSNALLAWNDATLHYTLVAEVGLVDLAKIAQSMEKP